MAGKFLELTAGASVREAQERYGSRLSSAMPAPECDPLGPEEVEFIETRDSFYLSTITESGWPYVQHRGGAPGFLRVVGSNTLAFADYKGNRQLLSTGNIAANPRAALFLMDYPRRTRLKLLGHARVADARNRPNLVEQFAAPEIRRQVERLFMIEVIAFNWNCPQYITPRFTAAEIETAVAPLKRRLAELETLLKPKI